MTGRTYTNEINHDDGIAALPIAPKLITIHRESYALVWDCHIHLRFHLLSVRADLYDNLIQKSLYTY